MDTQHNYQWLHVEGTTPIKGWVNGVPLEAQAHEQLRNIAAIPFVGPWVAVMPDVHLGKGATVGSVIPTRGAIIPAAVGVDIGCGMAAVRTTLRANDLPTTCGSCATASSAAFRSATGAAASITACPTASTRGWCSPGWPTAWRRSGQAPQDPHR